ncbi:acyltransferase [Psychrosphaera sp. 1_MG-2023]|uniref:acyltransferase family protein n=1 Tax=Psychrosphaera sp. 1_MG-2023 TaxID=3062643 RepID=UPI0026E1144F|nr:acyltransferase [Psychrosphaera sp. 1_MG-2023]MDO6720675.1 acyltransferase [Psychrosphaera sp. 1_MG-2023]
MKNTSRLSELDWLRVILIFAVFLHHVCMPFNGDGWHVMNKDSSKLLDDIMVYFEQIRLPTLFFISGVGAVLLLSNVSAKQFILDKLVRLFVPLLVGVLLVVPPQSYIENISEMGSFWQELPMLALKFDTNHLWFIEFLIVFALFAIPINQFLASSSGKFVINKLRTLTDIRGGLFVLVALLIIIKVTFSLAFPSDDNKIENLSASTFYLFFFIAGMVFIQDRHIWLSLGEKRKEHLALLLVSTFVFYAYYYSPDLSEYLSLDVRWAIWWTVCCFVAWSAMLTLLGYAQVHLTQSPKWLRQCNELIYPFYIFHQTVIVVIAYFIISWPLSIPLKIGLLLMSSFTLTSAICFFMIKPFNLFRFLFGLKPIKQRPTSTAASFDAARRDNSRNKRA